MPENNYHTPGAIESYNGHGCINGKNPLPSPYELKSDEVQEIMSKMPNWIIRRGTTVLFTVMILLLSGAYFIHYPDVIITKISIISTDPPVKIVAPGNGRIQRIFIQNNQAVRKNEILCILDNLSDYEDMLALKRLLNSLDTTSALSETIKGLSFSRHLQLGALQPGYTDLHQSVNQYLFFVKKNFSKQKAGHLQSQMEYHSLINQELKNKDILVQQQLMLETKKYLADSLLVNEKVIAPLEFDNSKKELINIQMTADETKTNILRNKLQKTEFLRSITDLQQQKLQQENDLKQKIRENIKRLQGQWEVWEQQFVLKSPLDGNAVFFKFWKEFQYVLSGEAVLIIVPPVQNYVARASLLVDGAGKVEPGQKTLIKLTSYPFEEFGMLSGRVESISSVAFDTAYSMEIQLVNGLRTTNNKTIPPQPLLTGMAEVLTSDKNILERLFEKIWIH